MSIRMTGVARRVLAAFVFAGALMMSDAVSIDSGIFVSEAEAIRGRPATPLSYAGVARRTSRRTTRRVIRRNTYVAPVAPTTCVQAVDVYGRIYTRCY